MNKGIVMHQPKLLNKIGLYEKALPIQMSWDDKLKSAKELGFDFLEISIDETDDKRARLDWSQNKISELNKLCEFHQIPLQSMCLSAHRKFPFGSLDVTIREQAVIHMQKAINLACRLGIRVIQLAGYDVYYESANEKTNQLFIEGMQYSAKLAEQAGVMLAVEIMDTNYLNSLSKFEILKREVRSPYFMAYPDVGNISGWNYDVCTELALSKEHIVQIHLKDTFKVTKESKGQFRDLIIGEGHVDFKSIFNTLSSIDYVAPFVIEMWANNQFWKENIVKAQRHLFQSSKNTKIELFSSLL